MENISELIKFIIADTPLTVIAMTYLVIEAFKKTEKIDNKYLPILSIFIGLIVGISIGYFSNNDLFNSAIIGCLSGGFATGLYETFKNLFKIK